MFKGFFGKEPKAALKPIAAETPAAQEKQRRLGAEGHYMDTHPDKIELIDRAKNTIFSNALTTGIAEKSRSLSGHGKSAALETLKDITLEYALDRGNWLDQSLDIIPRLGSNVFITFKLPRLSEDREERLAFADSLWKGVSEEEKLALAEVAIEYRLLMSTGEQDHASRKLLESERYPGDHSSMRESISAMKRLIPQLQRFKEALSAGKLSFSYGDQLAELQVRMMSGPPVS